MPLTANTAAPEAWKPTKAQVHVAALAIARVDDAGWRALTQSQRDDYLIDAHAALVRAHHLEPARTEYHGTVKVGAAVVCMTKEHADAYAALMKAAETAEGDMRSAVAAALARLRSLASPERTA